MKSRLEEHFKYYIQARYVVEVKIWRLKDDRYPLEIKYSFICYDLETGKSVLMDNHFPKNPHVHINCLEYEYQFENTEGLLIDFKKLVLKHLGVKI